MTCIYLLMQANFISATLNPISWNAVEFESDAFPPSNEQLLAWAIKWIDPEDTGSTDKFGFGGYLHSITHPKEIKGRIHFSVDFGSAPIACFYELFSVLINLGVTDLKIRSISVPELKGSVKNKHSSDNVKVSKPIRGALESMAAKFSRCARYK